MGSRITRAFGVTDRQRRVPPNSQNQLKSFIKVMSSSMFGFLVFGLGFLTAHSNQAHQHCLQYLAIAAICSIILNATNQQFCIICGWVFVIIQSLFVGEKFRLMFSVGQFLSIYAVLTNLFNYYGQSSGVLRNLKPSVLIIIGGVVLGMGHCCSHFIKQLRAEADGSSEEKQLNFGLRFVICFLGIMVVALTVMGHVHIRSRRFTPITIREQIKYLFSIKNVNKVQIVMLIIALRSLMINTETLQKCISGSQVIIILVFTICTITAVAILLQMGMTKFSYPNSLTIPNTLTVVLLILVVSCYLAELPYFITYPASICLNLLVIMHVVNKIENQLRINYVLSLIVAIICEANNIQHVHGQSENYFANCVAAGVLIPIALGLPSLVKLLTGSGSYREVNNGQSMVDLEPRN